MGQLVHNIETQIYKVQIYEILIEHATSNFESVTSRVGEEGTMTKDQWLFFFIQIRRQKFYPYSLHELLYPTLGFSQSLAWCK